MNKKNKITRDDLLKIITTIYKRIDENKEYLSKLDTEIGDGDHGFSMAQGFKSLAEKTDEFSSLDIGTFLKKCGFELIKRIGGSAGAVFGTFFTGQASYYEKGLKGKEVLSLEDITHMFEEAYTQIQKRGNARPGDKTMLDALAPAVESLQASVKNNQSMAEAFQEAAQHAKKGAEKTKDMIGRHGRSKYLGERGIGYIDPGAMSMYFIMDAMAQYIAHN